MESGRLKGMNSAVNNKFEPGSDRRLNGAEQLRLARGGNREALGEILMQLRAWLLLVAERELQGGSNVRMNPSDLVQQTFLGAQRDFGRFRGTTEAELAVWLKQNLMHNIQDAHRFYAADKRDVRQERSLEGRDSSSLPLRESLSARDRHPSSIVRIRERDEQIDRALMLLPGHYREVLLLRHRDDLTFSRIGEKLNLSAEASRKLWSRAVQALKRQLTPLHGFTGP